MLDKLRKKLICLLVVFTGTLLLVFLTILTSINTYRLEQTDQRNFETLFFTVVNKLQSEKTISNEWLTSMLRDYDLHIYIDNNGTSISADSPDFKASVSTPLSSDLQDRASEEGLSLTSVPTFLNTNQTDIYTLKGKDNKNYYSCAAIIKSDPGYLALYAFQEKDNSYIVFSLLPYIIFMIIGVVGIYILSRYLIKKVLMPVRENQEKQNQFIAAASHELRSPLSVIRSNNSYCKSEEDTPRRDIIELECSRMARLISDLLLLASNSVSSWDCNIERVDLDDLILNIFDAFMVPANDKNINIALDLPEEHGKDIAGDKQRLIQILSVLMSNALSYSPDNTTITISASYSKNKVILSIADHGTGIPDSEKSKVFERFYRVDKSRKDKDHFGLGLSIARQLTELQNGTITIKDTPGGGTTFVLTFHCWNE